MLGTIEEDDTLGGDRFYSDFDGYWWARLSSGELCGPYDSFGEAFNDVYDCE